MEDMGNYGYTLFRTIPGATAKQPCSAENPEALLPNNLRLQKSHWEK